MSATLNFKKMLSEGDVASVQCRSVMNMSVNKDVLSKSRTMHIRLVSA